MISKRAVILALVAALVATQGEFWEGRRPAGEARSWWGGTRARAFLPGTPGRRPQGGGKKKNDAGIGRARGRQHHNPHRIHLALPSSPSSQSRPRWLRAGAAAVVAAG